MVKYHVKFKLKIIDMKKLFLSAVAILFAAGAYAQTPFGYGIKAGINLPKYHINNSADTKTSTNFHVTAYLDAPLSTNVYLQPGISLQGKGAKLYDGRTHERTQNTMWLEIPVNAVVKFPTGFASNFYIGAGPYAAFGLSGKNKWKTDSGTLERDFKFGKNKSQKVLMPELTS